MNTFQTGFQAPQMKASDADRDAVVSVLSANYQAGRLTTEELDDRTGRALGARTFGELQALTADLPGPVPSAPQSGPIPAMPGETTRYGRPGRRRLGVGVAVIAVLVIVRVALLLGTGGHSGAWVLIPIALVVARIALMRRYRRGGGFRGGNDGLFGGGGGLFGGTDDSRPTRRF
jgi:hypothetical protein